MAGQGVFRGHRDPWCCCFRAAKRVSARSETFSTFCTKRTDSGTLSA